MKRRCLQEPERLVLGWFKVLNLAQSCNAHNKHTWALPTRASNLGRTGPFPPPSRTAQSDGVASPPRPIAAKFSFFTAASSFASSPPTARSLAGPAAPLPLPPPRVFTARHSRPLPTRHRRRRSVLSIPGAFPRSRFLSSGVADHQWIPRGPPF